MSLQALAAAYPWLHVSPSPADSLALFGAPAFLWWHAVLLFAAATGHLDLDTPVGYGQIATAAAVWLVRGCLGRLMVSWVYVGSVALLRLVV